MLKMTQAMNKKEKFQDNNKKNSDKIQEQKKDISTK